MSASFILPVSIDPTGVISDFLHDCLGGRFTENNISIVTVRHRIVLYLKDSKQYMKIATSPNVSPVGVAHDLLRMSETEWVSWHILYEDTQPLGKLEQYNMSDNIIARCYPSLGNKKLTPKVALEYGSLLLEDVTNKLNARQHKLNKLLPEKRLWDPRQELTKRLDSRFLNDTSSVEYGAAQKTISGFITLLSNANHWVEEYNSLLKNNPKIIVTDPTVDNVVQQGSYSMPNLIDLENISWGLPVYSLISLVVSLFGEQHPELAKYASIEIFQIMKRNCRNETIFDTNENISRIIMCYKLITTAMFNKDDKEKFNHLIQEANHLIHA